MDLIMKNKFLAALFLFHCSIHAAEVNHLVVPNGFKASLFANNLDAPRQIAEGDKGISLLAQKKELSTPQRQDKNGQIDDVKIFLMD